MKKWESLSIRVKLTSAFLFTLLILFFINVFLYMNVNTMLERVNEVYKSNSSLTELSETLERVQYSMEEYLGVKSTDTLEAYYQNCQELNQQLCNLNDEICGNEILMMERNIRRMSLEYLRVADEAMQAKRGRNIERYGQKFEEASQKFEDISEWIYSLNNLQFQANTESYLTLVGALRTLEKFSLVILLLAGIANAFLIYVLARNITGPLTTLAWTADQVAGGCLDVEKVRVRGRDEVATVAGAFNQMVESIRIYLDKTKENMEKEAAMKEKQLMMESHLKDAQLKYLQAQINPHFLFNTLNAGAQLAMMEGAEKTCLFVENMADFFRYNVKKINQEATLQEELELVNSYLYIMNVRFSGEIHFRSQVEEELLQIKVPSMILQPIVENAVTYGIRGIDWEGWISLTAERKEERIRISICDNGTGMSSEKIREVMEGRPRETDLSRNSTGIGLVNVISRLRLHCNTEDVLEIRSGGKDKGTEVILYLPYPETEKGENDV